MKDRWIESTLGEAYDVRDGTHDSPKYQEEGYALITSKNLKNSSITYDRIKFISEYDYININKRSEVNVGDILFAMIGTIGNPVVVKNKPDFAIKNVALFKVPNEQDSDFLKYYLESSYVKEKMQREAKGTTQKFVGLGYLRTFPISLPPLSEQKRIVAILDEAFAGIDTAIANTEKNLANARELFGSYLNLVFSQRGEGWEERKLSDYARSISTGPFGSLLHKSDYVSTGVPLVNPINIQGDKIVPDENKLIDASTKQRLTSYVLQEGDVVIARRGEIGRCAAIDKEQAGWVCGTGCFFIRPKEQLNPKYLANLIRSSNYRQKLEKAATGATMKNITNKSLGNLVICVPLLDRQISILSDIDSLSMEILRLESTYQQKLNSLKELKQSLLQKAFSGELTAKPDKLMDENMA